ncbi:hypothetical protein [Coxiella burnetii]|uniref:Uncharacterized protein n=1 Tax=Coxiella burnetii TaxID=777 RepID=A0A2I4SKF3_COXBE|nr:hypothetical protein [Coxiella burnetii]ACJ21246.1 hypothetical protein CbuK_A0012 [Coxiella burnetii CbuK_Q154]ASY91636.1 hypothetical protein [Coxiella burnetii]PHH57027.1 hypothetical protein CRH12_07835 [Coxiella burnetii]UYK70747.1 hypothetical protein OHM78_10740 [Coxiella burnetii]
MFCLINFQEKINLALIKLLFNKIFTARTKILYL